jgi:hypothetical protein
MSRWAVRPNVRECSRDGKCEVHDLCIGCIEPLPITINHSRESSNMDHESKIAYLKAISDEANTVARVICAQMGVSEAEFARAKAARAKAAETASAPRPGQFNLRQFSSAGATAIMAANASGKFLPVAGRDDFSDDRSNADDDETSESHRVGFAADLLNCEVSGESGSGCVHGDCDHVGRAVDCLTGFMRDEAARKRNLADAGKSHSVRFVA